MALALVILADYLYLFLEKISRFEKNPSVVFLCFPSDIHTGNGYVVLPFIQRRCVCKSRKIIRFFSGCGGNGNFTCFGIFIITYHRKRRFYYACRGVSTQNSINFSLFFAYSVGAKKRYNRPIY